MKGMENVKSAQLEHVLQVHIIHQEFKHTLFYSLTCTKLLNCRDSCATALSVL